MQFSGFRGEENIKTHIRIFTFQLLHSLSPLKCKFHASPPRACRITCLTRRPPFFPSKHTLIWKVHWELECEIRILWLTFLRCAQRLVSTLQRGVFTAKLSRRHTPPPKNRIQADSLVTLINAEQSLFILYADMMVFTPDSIIFLCEIIQVFNSWELIQRFD